MKIKHKAQRAYGKGWVYGYYIKDNTDSDSAHSIYDSNCNLIDIDPKTVCVYTGASDDNSKYIYTGDKLKARNQDEKEVEFSEVYYDIESLCFRAGDSFLSTILSNYHGIINTGNIHY